VKKQRTFKAGTSLATLAQFVRVAADELTGDAGSPELVSTVRVVVETIKADGLAVGPLLAELELGGVAQSVAVFLDYRRDEKRDAVKSVKALRRLLKPFAGDPPALLSAIEETTRQGWKGLFARDGGNGKTSRKIETGGDSDGGKW